MRTCEIDDCNRKHVAKGMCGTHYNKAKYPDEVRHRKIPHVCDCCGITFNREGRTQKKYAGTYCSYLCRDYSKGAALKCKLPADHWVYLFGATCEVKPPKPHIECAWCGDTFQAVAVTSRFCQPKCLLKFKRAKRRGTEHGAIGTYSWSEIVRLWIKFNRECAYCQTPTPLSEIQAEHVVPLSRGGANNLTNLLPSCRQCNSDKRDLLLPDWAADRAARGKPPVRTAWMHGDPLFMHLTSTISSSLRAA